MIDSVILLLIVVFLAGLLISFAMEYALLRPRPCAPWRRPLSSIGVHVGIWLVAYGLELALFRRPVFAVLNVLAIQALLVLVSQAKYGALREPFVYSDFEYFLDAIKHPRLYLPFFGRLRALAAGGGYGLILWAGLTVEDALTGAAGWWALSFADWIDEDTISASVAALSFWAMTALLVTCGVLLTRWAGRDRPVLHVSFDAGADLKRLGFLTALWRYRQHERRSIDRRAFPIGPFEERTSASSSETSSAPSHMSSLATTTTTATATASQQDDCLPDLLVVQSESFFDARRHIPSVRTEVLSRFDALKQQAAACGTLRVAAWGANTVRTEYAFLSGMAPGALGVHQFNPYRKLASQGIPTLASYLKSRGYRTMCIHPYPSSFYRRDRVYPTMGFDEFHDVQAFHDAARFGPYVSDAALAEFIQMRYANRDEDPRPWFIFVITMENHGPLHWEHVNASDEQTLMSAALPSGCSDLVAYVRHLANADVMFGSLADTLAASPRQATLCIYGDHVPIMPDVYRALGEPNGDTDYLIWRPEGQRTEAEPLVSPLAVEDLAERVLSVMTAR